eukprot:165048_1
MELEGKDNTQYICSIMIYISVIHPIYNILCGKMHSFLTIKCLSYYSCSCCCCKIETLSNSDENKNKNNTPDTPENIKVNTMPIGATILMKLHSKSVSVLSSPTVLSNQECDCSVSPSTEHFIE